MACGNCFRAHPRACPAYKYSCKFSVKIGHCLKSKESNRPKEDCKRRGDTGRGSRRGDRRFHDLMFISTEINTLCWKCVTSTAPSCLCDCLHLYTPSRTLRSASDILSLQIPRTRLCTVDSRAFSVFGPSTWNDLPLPLRQKPSLDSFKSNLKTFVFPKL